MSPHPKGGGPPTQGEEDIDFVVDPVGFGVNVSNTLSSLHNILRTSGWILTKFSWIQNWDNKEVIRFGDLELVFKVTGVEKLKILVWVTLFSLKTLLLHVVLSSMDYMCDKCMQYHSFPNHSDTLTP